jgi:hypothetical protein
MRRLHVCQSIYDRTGTDKPGRVMRRCRSFGIQVLHLAQTFTLQQSRQSGADPSTANHIELDH